MNPNCIAQVSKAAGRALTATEIKKIDDQMDSAMRQLARQDPKGWQAKSMDTRVTEAAQLAMGNMKEAALRKAENAQRQVLKTVETQQRIADLRANLKSSQSRALVEDLNNTNLYNEGVKKQYTSGLMDLIDAASSTEGASTGRKVLQFLFDAENPQMTRDLVAEIFAMGKGGTKNQIASQGAKAWLDTIESMRQRFNDAGGDVGKLDYGYLPQPHDSARIREAGRKRLDMTPPTRDEAQARWVKDTLPLLDRKQYLRTDGSLMNDAEVVALLRGAWDTLATDGMNKQTPGQFKGPGAKANSGSESRVLHFKDGEAYLEYNAQYGMGSMYDAMIGHIGGMARNIGLVERMGPNPNQQFRLQVDLAERADGKLERVFGNKPQAYWDIISGNTGAPDSARLAEVGQHIRNIQTFGKLAGAVISSITDLSTMMVTTGYNKLSYWELLKNTMTAGGKDAKEFANTHGMIAESIISDLNRWQGENIANNWSGRLANSTMKLSMMNMWTDTMRRGFSMTMMSGLGKLSKTEWGKLTEWDRSHLTRKGITEADWQVINQADLTDYRGMQMLTPEAIAAADIAQARPQDIQRIKDSITAQTDDLAARNAQDQQWVRGRIDKFDEARNSLNRAVKELLASKLKKNEQAAEPLLQQMEMLDARREEAKLQADLEHDYNKLFTKADVDAFEKGVREAGKELDSASKAAISQAERTGIALGKRLKRAESRMREAEKRAATANDAERELIKMQVAAADAERAKVQADIEIALKATPDAERAAFKEALNAKEMRVSVREGISSAERIGRKYGEAKGRLQQRMRDIEKSIAEMDRAALREANQAGKEAQAKAEAMAAELKNYITRSQERQQRRAAVIQRIQSEEAPRIAAESTRIKNEVTAKVLGFITDESEYAVMNPDIATRAIQTWGGQQAGTGVGELARATMQFKSFPIAMISRHWRRILESKAGTDGAPALANKAAYTAALAITGTALGAIAFQTKQVTQGKDPVDMTTPKFWSRAFAQGGGAGFLGDIVLGDTTQDRSPLDSLGRLTLGPTFGSAADVWELTKGNIDEAMAGKDTHAGAEALRFARSHTPYVNLWYGKAALDHLLLHSIQENLSPGYLDRQKSRAQQDWNQGFWWEPGETAPDRAPDLSTMGGQ
jgi:hypothetical protein